MKFFQILTQKTFWIFIFENLLVSEVWKNEFYCFKTHQVMKLSTPVFFYPTPKL